MQEGYSEVSTLDWVNRPILGRKCNRHGGALLGVAEVLRAESLPCVECWRAEGNGDSMRVPAPGRPDGQYSIADSLCWPPVEIPTLELIACEVLWAAFDGASFIDRAGRHFVQQFREVQADGFAWAWRVRPYQGSYDDCERWVRRLCVELGEDLLVPRARALASAAPEG